MATKPGPIRPEPMNVATNHAKVRISLSLSDPSFIAGDAITGKMEMECRADKGLGIGVMMVELFAIQELSSRDHHATSTFIHSRRVFQGPGYTPSNAVQSHPLPGDPQLPPGYYTARKGNSTFLFQLPVPKTSPNSISFGDGIATVRYEVRASVGVSWKGERRMLLEKKDVDIAEIFDEEMLNNEGGSPKGDPQGVVVAENGKIWIQATVVGGLIVAGESACIELQVKNHSTKKNSSLQIGLSRQLILPDLPSGESPPSTLQITDTLTTIPFKGPEYVINPGVEGVASLVFDVPRSARGVRGGIYLGDAELDKETGKRKTTRALFEVRCVLGVKMVMGLGSKDIVVEIPVTVVHPSSLPSLPPPEAPYYDYDYNHLQYPHPHMQHPDYHLYHSTPPAMSPAPPTNIYYNHPPPAPPMSPTPAPYSFDPNQGLVWLPPPGSFPVIGSPHPQAQYAYPQNAQYNQQMYLPPMSPGPHVQVPWAIPPRPSSAGPGGGRESTRPLPMVPPSFSPTSPLPPGLPPSSVKDVREVSSGGGVVSPTVSPPSSETRGRKKSVQNLELGTAIVPVHSEESPKTPTYPGELAESGTGLRASRIAHHLRVTSTAKGRGRSASPVGGMRYRQEEAHVPQHPHQPQLDKQTYAVATVHGNGRKGLHIPMPPPIDATVSLSPPLHSPRPILSPKRSFTKDPVGGRVVANGKSERVEELERMADEVGERTRDLSGDLPKEESLGRKKGKKEADVDVNKTLPKPKPISSSPLLSSAVKAEDYFGDAAVEATVSAPVVGVKTTKKYGDKGLGFGLGGERVSGLDALEKRLLAEVGTRKVENDKRPDVWSVLGVNHDKGDDDKGRKKDAESKSPKVNGGGASPIPIRTPRQGPVDPLNDSAISSLTLPDCDVGAGHGTGGGVEGGALKKELLDLEVAREREKQEGKQRRREKRRAKKGETDEDSDNKTSVGGKSLSGRTERQKKKDKERDKGGEGEEGSHGITEGSEKKERRSGHSKRRGKKAADARVAAWLGDVEAEVPTPPVEDVIAHTPSPRPVSVSLPKHEPEKSPISKDSAKHEEKPTNNAPPPSTPSRLPDPRSSGFVPIGTLKPDIYQRTLVPKDSPFASSNNIEEDARKITELWSNEEKDKHHAAPPQITQHTNPWKNLRSPLLANSSNGPSMLSPRKQGLDSEVKYDVRSARGGKGGQVTAVAAIWAAVADAGPSKRAAPEAKAESKPTKTNTSLSPPKPFNKAPPAGLTSSRPKNNDLPSPKSIKPNPLSATSSNSSVSSRSGARPRPVGVSRKFDVGKRGIKASPAGLSLSSSYAVPTLSTTASLAKPHGLVSERKQSLPLPTRVPHTINELPGKRLSMPAASKSGAAVSNLKAIAESDGTSGPDKGSDSPSSSKPPVTELAFGQARLRDLIKKYQGQAT
ncbi:hypothetical protein L218DRAFT_1000663 [Marasmius fiardii PR-910]|nr:hypothetical protein L218DRAFT_1000663 [Marasmius fiardii PR-910]